MREYRPFSLKPCPFCGSEVALTTTPLWHDGHGYQGCFEYSISCKNCGCSVGGSTCDSVYFSEQEAIEKVVKAWNRRKVDAEPVRHGHYICEADGYADDELVYDIWSCSECGCYFEDWDEKPTYNFCPNCGADMRGEKENEID